MIHRYFRHTLALAAAAWAAVLPAAALAATFHCDPARGDPSGDGSAERPWRTVEEAISAGRVQVRDRTGRCENPGAPVGPGDTILLRSGWHGVVRIRSGWNDPPIAIAAEAGQDARVGWVEIGEGRGWTVKGLTVSPSLSPTPIEKPPRHLVMLGERGAEDSSGLVVEDCFVFTVRDASAWTAKDWIETARNGIWLGRHGKGHVARNNYVLNTRFGIDLCAPECVCEGNVVDGFSADGIRATRDGQVVRHNVIKNVFVGEKDGDSNHDDGLQVFLFNVGTGTVRGITIEENIIVSREKDGLPFPNPLQGIGCFDGPLVDFEVLGNVVEVDHWHGVSLYDAQGSRIEGNACASPAGHLGKARPWVMLGQKKREARGNIVRKNFAESFQLGADPRVEAADNVAVTREAFELRIAELSSAIDARYGKAHPTARRPRLERERAPSR